MDNKCKHCGAPLKLTDSKKGFCMYCGAEYDYTDDNTVVFRDEAKIKELSFKEKIIEKIERNNEQIKSSKRKTILAIVLLAMNSFFCVILINFIPIDFIGICGLFSMTGAILFGIRLMYLSEKKNDESDYINEVIENKNIRLTEELVDVQGEVIDAVEEKYKIAGFNNIKCVALKDLGIFKGKNSEVEEVYINGSNEIEPGDRFNEDAKVIITYHSTKKG